MIPMFAGDPAASGHTTVRPWVVIVHPTLGVVDLSDRVVSFRVNASMDNAAITGSVELARSQGMDSLSPFITSSIYYNAGRPVLDPNINIFIGVDLGSAPTVQLISGRIDRVNAAAGSGIVSVNFRDESAYTINKTINEPTKYGSSGGTPSQDVMAAILSDWAGNPGLLNVVGTPNFSILEYAQEEMSVFDSLKRIAQQHGWDVRWFQHGPAGGVSTGFQYYDPREGASLQFDIHANQYIWVPTAPDITIGPQRYENMVELQYGDEDVRNQARCFYYDASDGGKYKNEYLEDTDSIARYGPRYMQIHLDRTTNIDSPAEAANYLSLALADTAMPFVSHKITLPCFPWVELNDVHLYAPNGDETQDEMLVVVGAYDHDYRNGHLTTNIGGRFSHIAAYRDYRRSVDRKQIIMTSVPDDTIVASEGTVCFVTDTLAFPA